MDSIKLIIYLIKNIFLILLIGIVKSQQIPFGVPFYNEFNLDSIYDYKTVAPSYISQDLIDSIDPIYHLERKYYLFRMNFEEELSLNFLLNKSKVSEGMELFFINESIDGYVGPYTKNILQSSNLSFSGQIKSNSILVEFSVPTYEIPKIPIDKIIRHDKLKKVRSKNNLKGQIFRQPNLQILLLGYWPPSNEAVRRFSTNSLLNPEGWIGENWEESGYDIISYFPSFLPPDCMDCGQGNGDFEVDYQDFSEDWWNVVDTVSPAAIITFSRGFIDNSWELEWQYFNSINWVPDYTPPYQPTPTPPDSLIPFNTARYSSLPMDSIVYAIQSANLGLNPYIDYTSGAGNFLSEFAGYHGVWYKAIMDSAHLPLYSAGHIHVGGLIEWETAQEATKVTLREVIKYVDLFRELPGDINDDGIVSTLDMIMILSHILNFNQLNQNEFGNADLNFDEVVDIYDMLLLSNVILGT